MPGDPSRHKAGRGYKGLRASFALPHISLAFILLGGADAASKAENPSPAHSTAEVVTNAGSQETAPKSTEQVQNFGPSASELIDRSNKALRGDSSHARMTMTIVTPRWSRDLDIEAWNQGREKALIMIHSPPKEKGNATLRRGSEMWVWMPKVEKVVKVPPTMMQTSWQGSDFTYEDIVKADSIVRDYTHTVEERKSQGNFEDIRIRCDPKPDAPVVWGKVLVWCRLYPDGWTVPIREEDFNERGDRARTIKLSAIEPRDGRLVPTLLECIPERKPGQRTSIRYRALKFNIDIPDGFFSMSRLQRSGI